MEKNFQIEKIKENSYIVRSDSERFGENEIVFQDISYSKCLDYIARFVQPKITYYVIDNFPCFCRWTMTEEQKEKRKNEKIDISYIDNIEDALALFQKLLDEKDFSDVVVNKDTGMSVPEIALGVCSEGIDLCDVLYANNIKNASGVMVEMNTDFIYYTKDSQHDKNRLGNIKQFVEDMEYVISHIKVTRARYLGKNNSYHMGTVSEDFFKELPTLRSYENYGLS